MNAQGTNLDWPLSVWQSLHQIDNSLGQPGPWEQRLAQISNILIETLNVEAIWLVTIKPLPPTACGLRRTPLAVAPQAQVQMIDKQPALTADWPPPDSPLSRVLASQQPYFFEPHEVSPCQADADMADAFFSALNTTPAAIVPFVAHERPVGALIVGCDRATACLSEQTRRLLTYLGAHLGAALHRAYRLEHAQYHADALLALNVIAHTITSSLDIDEVIQRTMAGINHILDVEAGSLLLVDKSTGELYFKITLRGENKQITAYRLQPGEGIAGWVVAHNRPVIANNAQNDKRFAAKIDRAIGFVTHSVICVPLLIRGTPIGALEVINKRRGAFDDDDEELLESMSAALGIALKNADLYLEVQERARRTELITQIAAVINTGHGLAETGKLILAQFQPLLPFDHISLSILDNSKESIRQWVFTEHGSLEYSKSPVPLAGSVLAGLIEQGQGRVDQNITAASPPHPDDQILLDENIKARLALPLVTEKSPFGCLNIGHRRVGMYGAAELSLLAQLVPQVAITIEKSWLIDVMERHNTELRGLTHLSEMLFSATDFRLIVDTAVSMLPRLLPGVVQAVLLVENGQACLGVAQPFEFPHTQPTIDKILDTFTQISGEETRPQLSYVKTLGGNIPVTTEWQAITELHLPLLTRLGPRGLIYVASGKKENLSDEVWRTFSLTAAQISAALENALLFQQVEQERARLAAILASSTDAVLVVNRDGHIVLDNPAAWQVLGVKGAQSGSILAECTTNETLVDLFNAAMQGGKPTGEIPTPEGRTFFANLSPVLAGESGVIGWVATMQDVSHFAELNELKDEFVNMVSHDLRSPLSAILIATELLPMMGDLVGRQNDLLDTIKKRVQDMQELINDLLDVGKIESGTDFELELCQLNTLVNEVVAALTAHANTKAILLSAELSEDLPPIMANPLRMRQVIHNLTDNALKYTPGEGRVTLKAYPQGQEIRLQVIDTGIGIPAADQPHIFEKFHRVKDRYVAEVKGTGLGLAITKHIVEKHNGRIWVESVHGQGSTFTVALPIHPTQDLVGTLRENL